MFQAGKALEPSAVPADRRGWDVLGHPETWYPVLRSADLPEGTIRAVHVCDRDLVLYRGASGRVVALDRFCSHLGADLDDGLVIDDLLRCPFHQLLWNPSGNAVNAAQLLSGEGLRPLDAPPVLERNQTIHVWLSPTGSPPTWEPPEFESDLVQLSRERVPIGCHLAVEPMACYDRDHGRNSHGRTFSALNLGTDPDFWQAGPDPDRPHILSVRVAFHHLRYPIRMRAYATFYGPAICSSRVEIAFGASRAFVPLGSRTYTGFIPTGTSAHIADSAVYVRRSAPFWHSYIAVGLAFWVHSLVQSEDMDVWNRQSHRPGGPYYNEFWTWYNQFHHASGHHEGSDGGSN
ncbi:Rieske 2Fe-2S domain-containing protein [Actinocorallia lasiicapitis]